MQSIAAALRVDLPKTLEAVRLADDHVGERMMDNDIGECLDHAENVAERPWQFCFVLGGGWCRFDCIRNDLFERQSRYGLWFVRSLMQHRIREYR